MGIVTLTLMAQQTPIHSFPKPHFGNEQIIIFP